MGKPELGIVITGVVMLINLTSIVLMGVFYRYAMKLISKKDD